MTKRSNGRNLIVGGARLDSGVVCYGNKSVNKMRRDCLAANKPRGLSQKLVEKTRKRERERVPLLSRARISYTGLNDVADFHICSTYTQIQIDTDLDVNEACRSK